MIIRACLSLASPSLLGNLKNGSNMTLKYLLVMNVEGIERIVGFLHVPIDSYILKAAKKEGLIYKTGEVGR